MAKREQKATEPKSQMIIEELFKKYPKHNVEHAIFSRNYKMERQKNIEQYQKQIGDGINVEVPKKILEDYIKSSPTEPP
ncbi:hypothetical protein B7463_g11646, partial [Scytalidium lignicola]